MISSSANLLASSGNRLYFIQVNNRLVYLVFFVLNVKHSDLLKLSTKSLLTQEHVQNLIQTKFNFRLY